MFIITKSILHRYTWKMRESVSQSVSQSVTLSLHLLVHLAVLLTACLPKCSKLAVYKDVLDAHCIITFNGHTVKNYITLAICMQNIQLECIIPFLLSSD